MNRDLARLPGRWARFSETSRRLPGSTLRVARGLGVALLLGLSSSRPALAAESLADKANARTLATEGIDLYNEGRFADALDRLQRAQALYDAPIHLLYIARAQTQLGRLVEATETYRRLIRVELTADTPAAVREAVEAGDRELDGVDARIAMLRIDVVPAGESGLVLEIDGTTVSAAVIGVERPLNPGHHRLRAAVPDGRSAETSIELGEGSRASVRLELGPAPAVSKAPPPPELNAPPRFAWFLGAGLGAGLPLGNLATSPEVPMQDYLAFGALLELHGGVRFARYFGVKLFVEATAYKASSPPRVELGEPGSDAAPTEQFTAESTASAQAVGLSFVAGSAPSRLGGYGELGVVLGERLVLGRELRLQSYRCEGKSSQTTKVKGSALRVGGGAYIPLSRTFQLVPFLNGSFGRFADASSESDCNDLRPIGGLEGSLEERRAVHGVIQLGISGELLLGVK